MMHEALYLNYHIYQFQNYALKYCFFFRFAAVYMAAIDHGVVLSCIKRKLRDVERLMIDSADYVTAKLLLDECNLNLERIRHVIPEVEYCAISDPIAGLLAICSSSPSASLQQGVGYRAARRKTG